jgi:FtsZ-interacting cell division protein ZipA
MKDEEKKDVVTAPEKAKQESPEELAKKLRDKNDLRIFGIAFMAALIVVAFYHLGRMVNRMYFNKYQVRSCKCRFQKPPRGGKPGRHRGKHGKPAAKPVAPAQANPAATTAKPVNQTAKPVNQTAKPVAPAPKPEQPATKPVKPAEAQK